jgi:ATP-dependent DNA helicase 2 subunit 2
LHAHLFLRPIVVQALVVLAVMATASADMMRKSIVFDIKTPKVFFCPQEKPTDLNKMIVQARPLDKLCEFGGKKLPKDYASDCYNDIDESDYACAEKERILLRINPPKDGSETTTTIPSPDTPEYIKVHKKPTTKVEKEKKMKKQ